MPTLLGVCRSERISLVFPLIDPDIPVLACHRRDFEAAGVQVAVVSEEAAGITADKWQTYQLFREVEAPAPRTWADGDVSTSDLIYPVFVKPRFGSAGRHAQTARDERELAFVLKCVPTPIVQEYLPGPEITNDVVCDLDGEILGVISRRRIEVRWGEVAKGVTVYNPVVTEACVRVASALRARGPITVQCIMKNGTPYFTEINARMGGGIPLAIAAGADIPAWYLAKAAGLPIDIPPLGSYRTGLYMTRFDESFFFDEAELGEIKSSRL